MLLDQSQRELDRLRSDLMYSTQRCTALKEEKAEAEKKAWEIEMKRRPAAEARQAAMCKPNGRPWQAQSCCVVSTLCLLLCAELLRRRLLPARKSLKSDLAALDKKCVMIQRRDTQYRHEVRKVEQNFEKVQEKLHKLILDKTTSTATGEA